MKSIVIAGTHSSVGKTTLAKELCRIIHGAIHIKIGKGKKKEDKGDILYPFKTSFSEIYTQHKQTKFLIIESNSILKEIAPDCTLFLTGNSSPKPSAIDARKKADIIRGKMVDENTIKRLSQSLGLSQTVIRKIAWLSGARPSPASAVILAGGMSKRMGRDKALLEIDGISMVKRLYDSLSPFFDHILISVGSENNLSLPFSKDKIVKDIDMGQGPLMGIYSALQASPTLINFVIACDIPEINVTLLYELLANAEEYDIAVPSFSEGTYEPLFAIYNKSATDAAGKILAVRKRKIALLFSECRTAVIPVPDNSWYINLNTPGDYHNYLENIQKVAG